MARLLITGGTVLTVNPNRDVIDHGAVLIDGDHIVEVGKTIELENKHPQVTRFDAAGKLIMPGLVNAHVHAAQILLRGGPSQDKNHLDWLANVLYPAIHHYDEETTHIAYRLFCIEAVRSGTTTIVDNVIWGNRKNLTDVALQTLQSIGLRTIYARIYSDISDPDQDYLLNIMRGKDPKIKRTSFPSGDIDETLTSIEALMNQYNTIESGLVSVCPAPGIPIFVSPAGLKGGLELAMKFDTIFTIHLAETETTSIFKGISVVEYLGFLNVLHPRLLAAHCVWVNDHDIRLLKQHDVKVANNVVSNMFLASGIAPVAKMLNFGLTVCLGTDDANCNNTVNMFTDMKFAALAQKVRELDASAITAEKVIEMATIDAARAIGLQYQIGSLEPGKRADLIIVDLDHPHLKPCFHIPSTLVYQANGSEVESVMVHGKWLLKNNTIQFLENISEDELLDQAQKASLTVLRKSGMEHLCNRGWLS